MGKNKNKSSDKISLTLSESLLPISLLIIMLSFNVYVYGDNSMSGSNQFILLLGAAVGIVLGLSKGLNFKIIIEQIAENLKSVTGAIIILLFVGALSGTWLISWYCSYWNLKSYWNTSRNVCRCYYFRSLFW